VHFKKEVTTHWVPDVELYSLHVRNPTCSECNLCQEPDV